MISKLSNLLGVLSLATLLALGGFAGYLFGTGRLNSVRLERMAAVLRGEYDSPSDAPASQPVAHAASQPVEQAEDAGAAEQIRSQRLRDQLRQATLERAASDVAARQALLNQALQQLITAQETFEKDKQTWVAQRKKLTEGLKDEGFQRELAYVAKLAPKQAKEHVLRTWNKQKADAVRLFLALDPAKGQRILEQFKTAEELQTMHELLEQLRLADVDRFAQGSRKTAGEPN